MKCKEIYEPRQVIENQLLVALDDKSKVAIVADEKLLSLLIHALEECPIEFGYSVEYWKKALNDLKQLKKAAFGC